MIHPDLQNKIDQFIAKAAEQGFNLRVTSGYRTPEEQQSLYEQGRSKPGPIVTQLQGLPICESDHCRGFAFDVVDRIKGYNIDWPKLGQIAKSVGLKWGGDWSSFPDKPHFYILRTTMTPQEALNKIKADFQNENGYLPNPVLVIGFNQVNPSDTTHYMIRTDNGLRFKLPSLPQDKIYKAYFSAMMEVSGIRMPYSVTDALPDGGDFIK